jgi:hypothetical protein
MSNRIGVIFHDDWNDFSPLMYAHNGGSSIPFEIKDFLIEYYKEHDINNHTDGHLYNPSHMMVGFLQFLDKDIHMRVENLSDRQINTLKQEREYPNCFDSGCWIINISNKNYGDTITGDDRFNLKNDNLFSDELVNDEDNYY